MRCHSRIKKSFTTSLVVLTKLHVMLPRHQVRNKFSTSSTRVEAKKEVTSQGPTMTKDLLVMLAIATIVEDPDTTEVSVRLPTKEEKTHLKGEAKEKNHHQEREGVEMIVMNEDPLEGARIRKGRTSHQGAIQNEDIKLMLVNGYPTPTLTTTSREVITPTPNILKMKVLPVSHLCHPTPTTYLIHQMKGLEDASWLKAPRCHTPSMLISIVMKMIC